MSPGECDESATTLTRNPIGDVVTCPVCGGRVLLTTYYNRVYNNRVYCSVRCRRAAEYAIDREKQRGRASAWDAFWAAVGDVPTLEDAPITRPTVVAAKSR
jgi:hypothetical protein